jgi:hypothetical protein
MFSPVIQQNTQPGTVYKYVDTSSDQARTVLIFHKQYASSLTEYYGTCAIT